MLYRFIIIDVFSAQPFGGNQLAVLTDARGLGAEGMQRIAREFNFAESTFVLPPLDSAHQARVRIFTPGAELPFAGHPTIGTACALVLAGRAKPDVLVLELGVGPLNVEVRRGSEGEIWAAFTRRGQPEARPAAITEAQAAELLGLEPGLVLDCFDASAGLPFSFIRLEDRAAVDAARLDLQAWSRRLAGAWAEQVFIYSGDVANGGELYARMFAPALGVSEDPATGSAAAALVGVAAARSGFDTGDYELSILQGVSLGRRSEISATARVHGGQVTSVKVGGFAAKVADGEIDVPEAWLSP